MAGVVFVAARQSGRGFDRSFRRRPSGAASFVDGFSSAVAVDVHFEHCRVMNEAINGCERHSLIPDHRMMPRF